MAFNEKDVQNLIKAVTQQVLEKLSGQPKLDNGMLALVPGYVFNSESVEKWLREKYPVVTCAFGEDSCFINKDFKTISIQTREDRTKLAEELHRYEDMVLITPPLRLIYSIAEGDDTEYMAALILRSLLQGQGVTLLLDFETPKSRRGTAFEKLADALSAVEKLGIKIVSLKQKARLEDEAKELITEQDILEASKNEKLSVKAKANAIITQLAQETAKELGIEIEK